MRPTMYPKVESSQSSGQLQKPFTTRNTPLPVTSGAMGACSMRFGVWDSNLLRDQETLRFVHTTIGCSNYEAACLHTHTHTLA